MGIGKIYFSIDIETNGVIAGLHSMISLGAAAINIDTNEIISIFEVNLNPIPDLRVDQDTMNWWTNYPEAYRIATEGAINPADAMQLFSKWVDSQKDTNNPIVAAWKVWFDVAFVNYYLLRFVGRHIFGRSGSGLDIKTLAALALNRPFSETQISTIPSEWRERDIHDHTASGDAVEQAHVLYHARKQLGVCL